MNKSKVINALIDIAEECGIEPSEFMVEKIGNSTREPATIPPATDKQIALMKSLKIEFKEPINKLEASKLLTAKIGDRPNRK